MKKAITKTKRHAPREAWNDQHRMLAHLLEEEIHGLVGYLRSLHYVAIFLFTVAMAGSLFALRSLFENGQHGVTGSFVLLVTCLGSALCALLALRPWVLPRFLLPMDIHQLRFDEMMDMMSSPREYVHILKHHVQQLTDNYLLRKLRWLRWSLFSFLFGLSVALVLCIALP